MVICARLISTVAERISDILDDKSSHSASRHAVEKQTTIAKWEEVEIIFRLSKLIERYFRAIYNGDAIFYKDWTSKVYLEKFFKNHIKNICEKNIS